MSDSSGISSHHTMSSDRPRPDVTASTDRRYSTVVTEFKRRKGILSSTSSTSGSIRPADVLTDTADNGGAHGKSYVSWEPVDESCTHNFVKYLLENDDASPDLRKVDPAPSELPGLSGPSPSGSHTRNSEPPEGAMDTNQDKSIFTTSTPVPLIVVTEEGESPKAPQSELKDDRVPEQPEETPGQQSVGDNSTTPTESSMKSWPESSFPKTRQTAFHTDPYPVFSEPTCQEGNDFSREKEVSHNRTYTVKEQAEVDPLFKRLEFEPSSVSPRTSYHTAVEMVTPLMYPPGDGSQRSYNLVSARNTFQGSSRACSVSRSCITSRSSHLPSIGSYSTIEVQPIEPIDLGGLGTKLKEQRKYRKIGRFLIALGALILVADAIYIIIIESMYPSRV